MAKKTTAKPRSRAGAKAAMAERSKDGTPAPKKKSRFWQAQQGGAAWRSLPRREIRRFEGHGKARWQVDDSAKWSTRAVGAVSSTVSSVAGQATSLFKRGRAEKTR